VVRIDLAEGTLETLAQDPDYDIGDYLLDPATGRPDVYLVDDPNPNRPRLHFTRPRDNDRLAYLGPVLSRRIIDVGGPQRRICGASHWHPTRSQAAPSCSTGARNPPLGRFV
jgi:hypothetical protein